MYVVLEVVGVEPAIIKSKVHIFPSVTITLQLLSLIYPSCDCVSVFTKQKLGCIFKLSSNEIGNLDVCGKEIAYV